MPTASEPRVVVRLSGDDHSNLQTAAEVAGVGISTLLRECAIREDRYRTVARELAGASGPAPTMAAPPAAPVPPAATFTFKCPVTPCERTFGSGLAICPIHGRRAVPA